MWHYTALPRAVEFPLPTIVVHCSVFIMFQQLHVCHVSTTPNTALGYVCRTTSHQLLTWALLTLLPFWPRVRCLGFVVLCRSYTVGST